MKIKTKVYLAAFAMALAGSSIHAQNIYSNDFNIGVSGNQPLSTVGWTITTSNSSDGYNRVYDQSAIYSYEGNANDNEALYTAPGSFSPISIAGTSGLTLSVDIQSFFGAANVTSYFIVETSGNSWFASATVTPTATGTFTTTSLSFTPTASNWFTLSGIVDAGNIATNVTLGSAPLTDLSGNIIAAGVLTSRIGGGTVNFDNFAIQGVAVPEPSTYVFWAIGLGFGGLAFFRHRKTA